MNIKSTHLGLRESPRSHCRSQLVLNIQSIPSNQSVNKCTRFFCSINPYSATVATQLACATTDMVVLCRPRWPPPASVYSGFAVSLKRARRRPVLAPQLKRDDHAPVGTVAVSPRRCPADDALVALVGLRQVSGGAAYSIRATPPCEHTHASKAALPAGACRVGSGSQELCWSCR